MTVKGLKGFKDVLPNEVHLWQHIENTARKIFHRFGFSEIKVPILEKTELFARSIGEATDIVEKEMYTFPDRNDISVTMRPEGTASVLRAYIEHGMHVLQSGQRLYTIGPMFRYERPQKGRLRQFHQMSVEAIGSGHPRVDAEVMAMAWTLMEALSLNVSLEINSLGCRECRPEFKKALVEFLDKRQDKVCADCNRRSKTNPLRVLDCKSENCQQQYVDAPSILDHLCGSCEDHFLEVREGLELLGIHYSVNSRMVRGLDYYTRTTFELITNDLGAQNAVGAGGRYDGLLEQLGGQDKPGVGFAVGMERLVLLVNEDIIKAEKRKPDVFLITLGEDAARKGFSLMHGLRGQGAKVSMDHDGRSMKSQMKLADKHGARYVIILGEDELANNEALLKNMVSGEQETVALSDDMGTCCTGIYERIRVRTINT